MRTNLGERRGRQKLERMLLEAMASGEAEDVTPEYLATLRSEAEEIIAGARDGEDGHEFRPALWIIAVEFKG